jgi:hypothetical protein
MGELDKRREGQDTALEAPAQAASTNAPASGDSASISRMADADLRREIAEREARIAKLKEKYAAAIDQTLHDLLKKLTSGKRDVVKAALDTLPLDTIETMLNRLDTPEWKEIEGSRDLWVLVTGRQLDLMRPELDLKVQALKAREEQK